MSNNIKEVTLSANCEFFWIFSGGWRDYRKLSLCQEVLGGRGVEERPQTHSNGHTGLLPCATYYYNYYYISIIVTLFTQRYHEKGGKLGSNCIKVPNSETYNIY